MGSHIRVRSDGVHTGASIAVVCGINLLSTCDLNSARPSSHQRSVAPKKKHRAENGSDPAGRVIRSSPENAPYNCSDQRADHPDDCGQYDSSWVASRHQQLRNSADNQTENDLPYQVHHKLVLLLYFRGAPPEARAICFYYRQRCPTALRRRFASPEKFPSGSRRSITAIATPPRARRRSDDEIRGR